MPVPFFGEDFAGKGVRIRKRDQKSMRTVTAEQLQELARTRSTMAAVLLPS